MSQPTALVEARSISKRFKLYSSPNQRLLEWLSFGRSVRHRPFWALKDIDLAIRGGECLGVIGANGSGKTTLLKILSGAMSPTSGVVRASGRVYALTDLRTGFNAKLTGRQNIALAGQMLGLDPEYVRARTDAVIEFADLGDFIDQPVRFYSSGMFARLGFSLFAFLEPDVLMIDEVLAVGDAPFKRKSFDLMEQRVRSEHRAVVYVSHAMPTVARLATHVLWIHEGQAKMYGDPEEAVNAYLEHAGERSPSVRPAGGVPVMREPVEVEASGHPAPGIPASGLLVDATTEPADQETPVFLRAVWLESSAGRVVEAGQAHQPFAICYALRFHRRVERPEYALELCDRTDRVMGVCNPAAYGIQAPAGEPGSTQIVRCPIARGIAAGQYHVNLVCTAGGDRLLDRDDACTVNVLGPGRLDAAYDLFGCPELPAPHADAPLSSASR